MIQGITECVTGSSRVTVISTASPPQQPDNHYRLLSYDHFHFQFLYLTKHFLSFS